MKRLFITFLLLSVLCSCASAWTLSHYSRNAYSFEPLPNVHVVLSSNDTNASMDGFSDTTGLTAFSLSNPGNYTITAYYPGYALDSISFYVNDSSTRISYLTYDSVTLVKFSFADMTFVNHEWCFYYDDNNRLYGCYYSNETLQLPQNHNYTVYPKMALLEQAGSVNILPFLAQISVFIIPVIIGLVVVIGLIIAFVFILISRLRGKH